MPTVIISYTNTRKNNSVENFALIADDNQRFILTAEVENDDFCKVCMQLYPVFSYMPSSKNNYLILTVYGLENILNAISSLLHFYLARIYNALVRFLMESYGIEGLKLLNIRPYESFIQHLLFKSPESLLRLIDLGLPINELDAGGLKGRFEYYYPPYLFAFVKNADIQENNLRIAQIMFEKGASLFHQGVSILSYFLQPSLPIFSMILNAAVKQDCVANLFNLVKYNLKKESMSRDYLTYQCSNGRLDLVNEVMTRDLFKLIPQNFLLRLRMQARINTFNESNLKTLNLLHEIIKNISAIVQDKFENQQSLSLLSYQFDTEYVSSSHMYLLDNLITTSDNVTQKDLAMQRIITDFLIILRTPIQCITYLQELETELQICMTKGQDRFLLDANYTFKSINGLYFPIPGENYHGMKKRSILTICLINKLKRHGFKQEPLKFIGFVPKNLADAYVISQHLFMESSRDINGLCHGKLSHMLQLYILAVAIEAGGIDVSYYENRCKKTMQTTEIIEKIISLGLWTKLLDSKIVGKISFSDPSILFSVLMHDGLQYNLNILSNCLIDSFCKGFIKTCEIYRRQTIFKRIDNETFAQHINDIGVKYFIQYKQFIDADIRACRQLGQEEYANNNGKYAVFIKRYNLDQPTYSKSESYELDLMDVSPKIEETITLRDDTERRVCEHTAAHDDSSTEVSKHSQNSISLYACWCYLWTKPVTTPEPNQTLIFRPPCI